MFKWLFLKVYVNQLTAEERSKMIKLTEKHCRQMMNLIYKKKMEYFKSGGEDWKEVRLMSYSPDHLFGYSYFKLSSATTVRTVCLGLTCFLALTVLVLNFEKFKLFL